MKFLLNPKKISILTFVKHSPPLLLQMLEQFHHHHHQLIAFVRVNLVFNYLLISWKEFVSVTPLTSTATIHVFIFC